MEVRFRNDKTSKISEIAISRWSPGTPGIETLIWVIENNGLGSNVSGSQDTSLFLYGVTKKLNEDDIPEHLADIFQGFRKKFERVYLAGYKINDMLSLIEETWVLPRGIRTIDTEKVWQAQHHGLAELSFEECVERTPQLREHDSSLSNAGNKAWLEIQLLRVLAEGDSLASEGVRFQEAEEASA
ncbi:hypothetical protein F5Y01DRAFT_329146 [Xylaria sp. FL0043]|nr:hypothetical protein F5Y01DRAFT_329146 [Xylaria sp. FL0043]